MTLDIQGSRMTLLLERRQASPIPKRRQMTLDLQGRQMTPLFQKEAGKPGVAEEAHDFGSAKEAAESVV